QVRRLPVVDDDGTLVGVVAQADIAREGDHEMTGQLVEEISESGGQMSSFEERQYPMPPLVGGQLEDVPAPEPEEPQLAEQQPEEPSISKVQSTSRGRKRAASSRKRKTAARKTAARKTAARKSAGTRKRKTAARKAAGARKRKTAARK